jgi:hypothetical protein
LKAVRQRKQIIYKGKPIKITADFSTETLKARRAWGEIFLALNENSFNPRILHAAKLSFKIDGAMKVLQYAETKTIHDHKATTKKDSSRAGSTKL